MLCQFCKEREATIHFTNVIGKNVEKIHICTVCAEEKGFDYLKKSNFEKVDLLAGLMNLAAETSKGTSATKRCPGCGRTYAAFKKSGKLGCAQCYDIFRVRLDQVLSSIHGDTTHKGKVPVRYGKSVDLSRRIEELQYELGRVIELEQYEQAAVIRDEIKILKEKDESEGRLDG
ncbi:MAG: UvrB/UvrC motif-containing protein [Candidatus Krumholzibacteriota bacterium]|nr:UvrB/UvrC motif-containing protein [Candidatus Krumholzibacteriota bacterium]